MPMPDSPAAASSPCVGICMLTDGVCLGCARTVDEIAAWGRMAEPERCRIMREDLPRRMPAPQDWATLPRPAVERALHPLHQPPRSQAWNHAQIIDLLPQGWHERPAAVLMGLLPRAGALHVVLTRRGDTLREHPGQVSFPGGGIDPGDVDPVAAALREASEEIGLHPAQARPLGFLDPFLTISGFRVLPVVAWLDSDFRPRPEPGEVAEVFDVPLEYLMRPDSLRGVPINIHGHRRTVLEYAGHDAPAHRIWGATAAMLFNFRQRVRRSSAFALQDSP